MLVAKLDSGPEICLFICWYERKILCGNITQRQSTCLANMRSLVQSPEHHDIKMKTYILRNIAIFDLY